MKLLVNITRNLPLLTFINIYNFLPTSAASHNQHACLNHTYTFFTTSSVFMTGHLRLRLGSAVQLDLNCNVTSYSELVECMVKHINYHQRRPS
jgi:hypothetical protein